jgi:eukaryotic-like serine/threonine-protein kinase
LDQSADAASGRVGFVSDEDRSTGAWVTPERWAQLEPLIDAALDLAPDRRARFYDRVASSHPELRADLERLIGRAEDDRELFASAAAERFGLLFDGERQPPLEILPQLQASLGTAYTLERELGGAGMSRVFLARESELGRRVVVKVLPPELAAGINAERFDREIKLAASLQQANVVPLLATGRAAGYAYYTMPFVEGRSLRDRLMREGVLPIGDAMNLLRDVARALAYAHQQGIVHRDIKPGNVLLSGGTAVVTDFGIAKALTAARAGGGFEAITHAGPGIGTPPYMAPEQAAGDPTVDHRADIYAFGCLAYEVFTGKPPFHGHAPHVIIASHFQDTPRPVTEGRSDVPPAIAALIAQCLEKSPARRPQSATDLLDALDAVTSQPIQPVRRRTITAMAAGAVVLTAAVVAVAAYLAYRGARVDDNTAAGPPMTLAALPFRNLSRDSALEHRADSFSDKILTAMGHVPGIRIVGRNASLRYKDRNIDEQVVERELGAVFLITGTYQERDGRITVSAQVNDSITRGELWSDTFEVSTEWRRWLPDSIARVVAEQLHARYAGRVGESKRGAIRALSVSNEADDNYKIGLQLLKLRGIRESVKSFETAIRLDPKFAQAYGGLAMALTLSGVFANGVEKDSILNTAHRALDLDSTVAAAHAAIASGSLNYDSATMHFRRALALEPSNFEIHFAYARFLTLRGYLPEAREQFELARMQDQVSALLSAWSSYAHFLIGETTLAKKEIERAFRLDSTAAGVTNLGALLYIALQDSAQARRLVQLQQPLNPMITAPYVYAVLHDTATALSFVTTLMSTESGRLVADVQRATVMLAIGDSAGALSALENSDPRIHPLWIAVIPPCDPAWDLVRQSPRFATLVRKAGLNERSVLGGCRRR